MPDTHTHANTHTHTHAHKSTQPHHKKQLETEIPILYKLCAYTFMRKGFVFRCLDDAVTCHLKDLWPTTPFVSKRTVVFHADIWRLTYYPTKHKAMLLVACGWEPSFVLFVNDDVHLFDAASFLAWSQAEERGVEFLD
jgi:hypothetical protein